MAEEIGVGIVGTGYMGAAHALAFRAAPAVFETALAPRLAMVSDIDAGAAAAAASRFGFDRWTEDWRELVADPAVQIVAITTPNHLHPDIALAAMASGKHVYCEKPLAADWPGACAMAAAAASSGVATLVGYNYARSPAIGHARALLREGAIGDLLHFRGVFDEDYMAAAETPFSWRCRRDTAGLGALGDLGSHVIHIAVSLLGPVASVVADSRTLIRERTDMACGGAMPVENDDSTHALLTFRGGTMGSMLASRVHWGRKNHFAFELHGTRGSILYDQERMNELSLFERGGPTASQGFRTILTGPEHPPHGRFTPGRGHSIGFNDLKTIDVAHLLEGIAGREALHPTIPEALEIERVTHAIARSAAERRWVEVTEVA